MVRRLSALLLALLILAPAGGLADLKLKEGTPAQKMLKEYITNVNEFLVEQGEMEINRIFEQYDQVTVLGITYSDDAELPEGIEITVYLYYDSPNSLQLRVNNAARFPKIAAAFLRALSPATMTMADALAKPAARAKKAETDPANSFEDEIEELNGTTPRAYYAYFPNQYHDGVNWLQMTIIFPLEGYWDAESGVIDGETPTRGPDTYSGNDAEYDGYFSGDDFEHLEIFMTPTPEPDSAAWELDNWY